MGRRYMLALIPGLYTSQVMDAQSGAQSIIIRVFIIIAASFEVFGRAYSSTQIISSSVCVSSSWLLADSVGDLYSGGLRAAVGAMVGAASGAAADAAAGIADAVESPTITGGAVVITRRLAAGARAIASAGEWGGGPSRTL